MNQWQCARLEPGSTDDVAPGSGLTDAVRDRLDSAHWIPAAVPGTAAGAVVDAGDEVGLLRDYDSQEWWFRTSVTLGPGRWVLHLDGLATLADVWLGGRHLLRSENMFLAHELVLDDLEGTHDLLIRCAPLSSRPVPRRPRPRWRTVRVNDQAIRWTRTTLLGRTSGQATIPAPVGPWRPVRLEQAPEVRVRRTRLTADGEGRLVLEATVEGATGEAEVRVGDHRVAATIAADGALHCETTVPDPALWWPQGYGDQPLHDVDVIVAGQEHRVGRVGFRTVEVDRTDGAFTFVVNGVPVFARGTLWMPPDPDRLVLTSERLQHNVDLLRRGHHTMVRIPGNTVDADDGLLDALDEAGILLWHDAMFAFVDVPAEESFTASAVAELRQLLTRLQGRPCTALVCGGADTEEQAQYQGVPHGERGSVLARELLPRLMGELLPGTAYLASTPGGSTVPTVVDEGVAHYFGVGPYLRPPSDARAARVRFSAETLPFATPTMPLPLGATDRLHRGLGTFDPRDAVHRDHRGAIWDLEDTRDHYVGEMFGHNVLRLRQEHPERAELTFAATCAELYERTFSEWRRAGSGCAGALTLYGHDLRLGPGIGLVDALDRPKATWYALRRVGGPRAVLLLDEGFNGLDVHLVNDAATSVEGRLVVDLFDTDGRVLESADVEAVVPPRGGSRTRTAHLFETFRDLTHVHRFGDPVADVVLARWLDATGASVAEAVHLPGGPVRRREDDLGLQGTLTRREEAWVLDVRTERFAQWVCIDAPGWWPEDSWFHLAPGHAHHVPLLPLPSTTTSTTTEPHSGPESVRLTAFNSDVAGRVTRD